MNNTRSPILLLCVLLVGLSACKPREETTESAAPSVVTELAADLPLLDVAPSWSLPDLDGNLINSDQFKGKVVVVDFWATWCPPCRVEIPGYIKLQEKYGKDGLVIIGVSLDRGGPDVVRPFAEKVGVNYLMLMADSNIVDAFGGFSAIPTTFLIDREGNIRDVKTGVIDAEIYEKTILKILN